MPRKKIIKTDKREELPQSILDELKSNQIEAFYSRERIKRNAARLYKILNGFDTEVKSCFRSLETFSYAPKEIPDFVYKSKSLMSLSPTGDTNINVVGSIGYYFVEDNPNLTASEYFDTGFYLGVLAARDNLVKSDQFSADTVFRNFENQNDF